jgi:molecular chaperone GrpE (heat shock protein)
MQTGLWDRLARLFSFPRGKAEQSVVAATSPEQFQSMLSDEFRGLRRSLRKQAEAIERLEQRLDAIPRTKASLAQSESLMQLAQAFHHLDRAFRSGAEPLSPPIDEAFGLYWRCLDDCLERSGLGMIRETKVAFDARLHRAMAAHGSGDSAKVVHEVLEPGFLRNGVVHRPAQVILGPELAADHGPCRVQQNEQTETDRT